MFLFKGLNLSRNQSFLWLLSMKKVEFISFLPHQRVNLGKNDKGLQVIEFLITMSIRVCIFLLGTDMVHFGGEIFPCKEIMQKHSQKGKFCLHATFYFSLTNLNTLHFNFPPVCPERILKGEVNKHDHIFFKLYFMES